MANYSANPVALNRAVLGQTNQWFHAWSGGQPATFGQAPTLGHRAKPGNREPVPRISGRGRRGILYAFSKNGNWKRAASLAIVAAKPGQP